MTESWTKSITRAELEATLGQTLGVSRWFDIPQGRIDAFADTTEDWQFIHLDPERAAAETPFGGTVAHGYLTVSMLSAMAYDAVPMPEGMSSSLNYGFDRLRFVSPVKSGARLRGRFDLTALEEKSGGRMLLQLGVTIEIDGQDAPAVAADWLVMYLP